MINLTITDREVKATEAIKDYVERKLQRIERYFGNEAAIDANLKIDVVKNYQVAEIYVTAEGASYKAVTEDKDLYAAIDLVTDKLERQIRKNKTRLNRAKAEAVYQNFNLEYELENGETEEEEIIVKRKNIEMKPMDEEEAILQMNLLGHEFFVYKDMHTNNVCVLYKRKDGNYGLIETK